MHEMLYEGFMKTITALNIDNYKELKEQQAAGYDAAYEQMKNYYPIDFN